MATRAHLPSPGRFSLRRAFDRRFVLPPDWRQIAWRIASGPWWIGSDIPRLPFPARDPAIPDGGLAGNWVVRGIDRIIRRIWAQRAMAIVLRGVSLSLLVGCGWLAAALLGGPAFDRRIWFAIGVVLMLCSVVIAALSRPTRVHTARMLDRSFELQERVSTALGNIGRALPVADEHPSIVYLQVADAANAVTLCGGHPSFRLRPPVREPVLAIALGLTFVALAFARGTGAGVPDAQANAVPAFVPAVQRFVQPAAPLPASDDQPALTAAEIQQMMERSLSAQHDLQALADALADHAVTRDAAQSIRDGDYRAAAEELRTVSTQADQLSEAARQDLASDLTQAASQMSEGSQALADAAQQAADGLNAGGDAARSGMRDLANAVEQSGQQVQSPEAIDQAAQQAQQSGAAETGSSSAPSGAPGQSSANQTTGGESRSGDSSDSSETGGQPGQSASNTGADAEAGIGADPDASSGQPDSGAPAQSDKPGAPGQASESGQGNPVPGDGSAAHESQGASASEGEPQDGDASQGSGAGSSSGQLEAQGVAESDTGGAAQNDSAGRVASHPKVSDANSATTGQASQLGDDSRETVQLSRQPGGSSVRIGGSSGASSLGSGAGVTVSSGSTEQGEVGANGPDSNHVPADYRDIVEGYFSDKDGGR